MKKFKIPTKSGRYYAGHWLELFDGGSSQWLYVARNGLCYVFIEILDMPAYCGRDAYELWNGSVDIVNLAEVSTEQIAKAIESCGYDMDVDFVTEGGRLAIAEALFQYGAKSPMWNESAGIKKVDKFGNIRHYDENSASFRGLKKEAREIADQLLQDEEYREKQLDTKIVNKIGQTARQYATGTTGLWNTLRDIKNNPNATDEQKLFLKMYQNAGQTLGAGPVPNDIMEDSKNE